MRRMIWMMDIDWDEMMQSNEGCDRSLAHDMAVREGDERLQRLDSMLVDGVIEQEEYDMMLDDDDSEGGSDSE